MKALIVGLNAIGLLLAAGPAFSQENDHPYGRYSQPRQQTNQRPYMEFTSHPQRKHQDPYMEFRSK